MIAFDLTHDMNISMGYEWSRVRGAQVVTCYLTAIIIKLDAI